MAGSDVSSSGGVAGPSDSDDELDIDENDRTEDSDNAREIAGSRTDIERGFDGVQGDPDEVREGEDEPEDADVAVQGDTGRPS